MNTKRLPFWLRIKQLCVCDVLDDEESHERHTGPFVCLRDMFGRKYYLCLTCFYTLIDEERDMNIYMIEEEKKKIKPVMKLGIS
jgi:hypothetical protein